ncbi:uridine kinase [Dictyocaulus viviparus]|uniref:Uridine kinase n=1 Tax=Dictyocaulus viviparus TaxID=29172 RepID=A0A0D8XVD8_DICVI|nr:uridine kinase [Dictyocaulus viviparus]
MEFHGMVELAGAEKLGKMYKNVQLEEMPDYCNSSNSSVNDVLNGVSSMTPTSPTTSRQRLRTMSGTKTENHLITTRTGRKIYTKGRPPWYDRMGNTLKQPYLIGISGGCSVTVLDRFSSASGKTTVAEKIIEKLEIPWVTILSMDSFYKILNEEECALAAKSNYNFDHPNAFDFDLLREVLSRLREGKSCEVPVYDFTTHSRDSNPKVMYGADVLIFEGILAFYRPDINDMMDMKVFVDTDADVRLARRLNRDINERGRDIVGVLDQYFRFVKPAFEAYIAPGRKIADIIVPRGGENDVAINLIAKQVMTQLIERGYDQTVHSQCRHDLVNMCEIPNEFPENLTIIRETPQVRGLHTFIRNKNTKRDEIIFYTERLTRILIEEAMNFMPYKDVEIELSSGQRIKGCRQCAQICGIAIMRAGETMENSLRAVVKDCKDIGKYKVMLLDATVATGAAAMMAIRILLDHDVPEENIYVLSLLMSEPGVHALAYAFPKVRLITTAVDSHVSDNFYVLPGMGNFGDRYYGTYASDNEEEPFDG